MPVQNNDGRVPVFTRRNFEWMRIKHSRVKSVPQYSFGGKPVKGVQHVKDLGVTISSDLYLGTSTLE